MDDIQNDKNGICVILKLFERGQAHTPLLQKIFLYLDPRSLKNCKLTCSQWNDFIDREIWKSISAKKVLCSKLLSNWKDDFVTVRKISLEHKACNSEGTEVACDENVMVFSGATVASVYSSSTEKKLYTVTLPEFYLVRIGDDFIAFISEKVLIFHKYTGQLEYEEQLQEVYSSSPQSWRIIGNSLVVVISCGDIIICSKDPETLKWIKQVQKSGIKLVSQWGLCICGDGDYLVIAVEENIHLWDWRKGLHTGHTVQCARAH